MKALKPTGPSLHIPTPHVPSNVLLFSSTIDDTRSAQ
jgi:hypothetical protein